MGPDSTVGHDDRPKSDLKPMPFLPMACPLPSPRALEDSPTFTQHTPRETFPVKRQSCFLSSICLCVCVV